MDAELIRGWKKALESDIASLSGRIEALTGELRKKREQLDLLEKLLNSETVPSHAAHRAEQAQESKPTSAQDHNPTPNEVKDGVLEILREAGRPMNIKEIHAEFLRRSLPIPGKGTPFNILVHMTREIRKGAGSRFYRTGRGTYALRRSPERRPGQKTTDE